MGDEAAPDAVGTDDGTGAVLYGMFTSFTEVLGDLEGRLESIEAALRHGPPDLNARLAGLERSVLELSDAVRSQAGAPRPAPAPADTANGNELAALAAVVRAQSELLDQRTAALAAAIDALRVLLQTHVDDTAQSIGRRAGEAGRRLASDLGLRARPKPPPPLGP